MSKARKYTVVAPMGVTIPVGVKLTLTPEQAGARGHVLTREGTSDVYATTGQTAFKRGEVIAFADGEVGKVALGALEAVDKAAPAKKGKNPADADPEPDPEQDPESDPEPDPA